MHDVATVLSCVYAFLQADVVLKGWTPYKTLSVILWQPACLPAK